MCKYFAPLMMTVYWPLLIRSILCLLTLKFYYFNQPVISFVNVGMVCKMGDI